MKSLDQYTHFDTAYILVASNAKIAIVVIISPP